MKKIILGAFFVLSNFSSVIGQINVAEGYTDKSSYRAGESIDFLMSGVNLFGNNTLPLYAIDGSYIMPISGFQNIQIQAITTANPWRDGYGYNSTNLWTVPPSLKSGYYFIPSYLDQIPIIIKGDKTEEDIVVVVPTNTYQAYNNSGGINLYNSGYTTVSFLRPLKKQANGQNLDDGFLSWITTWGAIHNYKINFISDLDMEDFSEIENAKMLIIPGHSEYWSRQARLNFDKFVDSGKDALILSGNTMWWQVRYESTAFNFQLICHRGANWNYDDDPIANTDPLLATYHWNEPSLKYSIIGSIGSDWLHGGLGVDASSNTPCYGGFNGDKIVLPESPLLNGLGFSFHDILSFATGEYDGTLMKTDAAGNVSLDGNGDPQLDISALGFYRAELVGYDIITDPANKGGGFLDPNNQNNVNYCPFMVFQKTCTSGTIINVNSNEWCANWGIGYLQTGELNPNGEIGCSQPTVMADSRIPQITENMITLMMQDQNLQMGGDNLFYNSPPASPSFSLKPAYTNVSYNACSTGSIRFTPCGVYMTDGYKVDNGFRWNYGIPSDNNNNIVIADLDASCSNYNNGLRQINSITNLNGNNSNEPDSISVFPIPASNLITIAPTCNLCIYNISIADISGKNVLELSSKTGMQSIDVSSITDGVYFVTFKSGEFIERKKIIVVKQ